MLVGSLHFVIHTKYGVFIHIMITNCCKRTFFPSYSDLTALYTLGHNPTLPSKSLRQSGQKVSPIRVTNASPSMSLAIAEKEMIS